jgi:PHD/YefM family antitoxin component YafN of YafNO toxin-antitoxin module
MDTLKVGIREFREKLASYLLETEVPVAITRHGDTIGYYIPARRKRSEAERTALKEAAIRLQQALAAEGSTSPLNLKKTTNRRCQEEHPASLPCGDCKVATLPKRRLKQAGLPAHYSPRSFRATGITNFLENDGTLEAAQRIAGHADSRTTKLYDRRGQKVLLEDMERIRY